MCGRRRDKARHGTHPDPRRAPRRGDGLPADGDQGDQPRRRQVETGFPLQLDSLHEFRLTLGDRSVVVKGRVAHCSISDVDQEIVLYRSGIEFIEPSERVFAVITDFIDAIRTADARSRNCRMQNA